MKQLILNTIKSDIILILFTIICAFITLFYAYSPSVNWAGDIIEYYGMTETLLSHTGLSLRVNDEIMLKERFPPQSLTDTQYYVKGRDGNRYPVHFFAYSLLVIPTRLVLETIGADPVNALIVTNVFIMWSFGIFVMLKFARATRARIILLILLFFSPLTTFFYWPGPDLLYLSVLIISIFYFFERDYHQSAFLVALASWHSQPLVIATGLLGIYFAYRHELFIFKDKTISFSFNKDIISKLIALGAIVIFPYILNLYMFGVLTPWIKFDEGWTVLNGFGIHNASIKKLFEQFFDLNFGIFWYIPITFLVGIFWAIKNRADKSVLIMVGIFLLTAFFYQTNPAWHYGTAGFGPSRHAIFLLPLLIYFAYKMLCQKSFIPVIGMIILVQGAVLYLNGGLKPDLIKTLYHSPLAKVVLDYAPRLYSPTPEIFVDRTLHSDLHHLSTAIYKKDGECKKAFVLITDGPLLKKECGFIPKRYLSVIVNEFSVSSINERSAQAYEATFWPDSLSCSQKKLTGCIVNYSDFLAASEIDKPDRIIPIEGVIGAWKLVWGTPVKFVVPPGYHMDYFPTKGVYVDY